MGTQSHFPAAGRPRPPPRDGCGRARRAERGGAGAGPALGHLTGTAELGASNCIPLPAAPTGEAFPSTPPSCLRLPAPARCGLFSLRRRRQGRLAEGRKPGFAVAAVVCGARRRGRAVPAL